MAAGVLRVINGADGPSQETEPFDIHDLCARLDIAKREREEKDAARALRKQVRDAVRKESAPNEQGTTATQRRPKPTPLVNVSNDWSRVQIPGLSPLQEDEPQCFSQQSTAVQSPSGPTSPSAADRSHETPTRPKRLSFFKSLSNDSPDTRLRKDRPDDVAQRRSQTSPLLRTRFRNDSHNAIDSIACEKPAPDHSMSFVNEYCVSFDTHHQPSHTEIVESPQALNPLPINRPGWAYHHSERSLLNLPLMLRKDRKEKVSATVDEVPEGQELRTKAPRSRPHTRSNTAPEGLICEAVRRIEREERGKKRRSMGAFLQTILLPNHSSVNAASSHCVAI